MKNIEFPVGSPRRTESSLRLGTDLFSLLEYWREKHFPHQFQRSGTVVMVIRKSRNAADVMLMRNLVFVL